MFADFKAGKEKRSGKLKRRKSVEERRLEKIGECSIGRKKNKRSKGGRNGVQGNYSFVVLNAKFKSRV